ncbi:MAG: phosphate ABC transporter substrate-binding/OmpA family protein [Kofleriaceae bacterium]
MSNAAGKPKPTFFIAVLAVVAGLIGLAAWRCNSKSATKEGQVTGTIDPNLVKKPAANAEDPSGGDFTTAKTYEFVEGEKMKPVEGAADYKAIGPKRVVKFAINVWAGWAPIIYANGGKGPGKVWKAGLDKDGKPGADFQVELQLIDDPSKMTAAFASGDLHIGWATVDMLPLIAQRLNRDPRTMPRVFQQVDWSNGGDGIIARDNIKSISDLKGKTVVLAQNSPSHYFLLSTLLSSGVQPKDVNMKFTQDAFQAALAFKQDSSISAAVSWAPDIYTIPEKVPGTKTLLTTGTANKMIGDVWFARADFARDYPDIVEGLVRGIFDAMVDVKDEAKKAEAATLMDKLYDLPPGSGKDMWADAHSTNFYESRDFLLNQNNPTNFENTYETAYQLYDAIRVVDTRTRFDQILDIAAVKALYDRLATEEKYAKQTNEYQFNFTPTSAGAIDAESAVITKTVVIKFFPNSFDLKKKVSPPGGGAEVPYDPTVDATIKEIAQLSAQYGAARIQIEGHTDASKRGEADESLVRELSLNRANAVKQELVNQFKLAPNQFVVAGLGWDRPADPRDPNNHAKNRRVEIKVIPAEAQ